MQATSSLTSDCGPTEAPRTPRPGPRLRLALACLVLMLLCSGASGCARVRPRGAIAVGLPAAHANQTTGLPVGSSLDAELPAAGQEDRAGEADVIFVHVSGAVVSPGVYCLPAGSRAWDGVTAAGGLASDASPSAVNLAAPLADAQQLHIPTREEAVGGGPVVSAGGVGGGAADTSMAGRPIDLNAAGIVTLVQLPGIGPVLAQRIVAYRQANGPYRSVDDLLRVSGIGAKRLAELRSLVTVR